MAATSSSTAMDTHDADLFGLPLEIRHKIYGFCSQTVHGPDLLLKAWLDKLDAKQAAARAQATDNTNAATVNDDGDDVENEAEAEDDTNEGAVEETEEDEAGQEELPDTADTLSAPPANAATQQVTHVDAGSQTTDPQTVFQNDQDMSDVIGEASAEMAGEPAEEQLAMEEDEGDEDEGEEEPEASTYQLANGPAPEAAIVAAAPAGTLTTMVTGQELSFLISAQPALQSLATGGMPALPITAGLNFTQAEAQALSDLAQVCLNALGGNGPVPVYQQSALLSSTSLQAPVPISQPMALAFQVFRQQFIAQQATLPTLPPPQPRDTKWRHAIPIIQFSHCPPPVPLLLINKQLYNEAITYYYDMLTLKINVTEAFPYTSFYELLTETIANATFSPIEQVQKVELTFVWDTVWIKSQHNRPTDEDEDEDDDEEDGDGDDEDNQDEDDDGDGDFMPNPMDTDPATKQSILCGLLNKRADVTADLLRMMPNLKSLKIKWFDSQNSDEAIVQKFATLEEVQQAVPMMCDVEIEDHFETNAKSVSSTSVLGRRRLEFQALQDGGWNFQ